MTIAFVNSRMLTPNQMRHPSITLLSGRPTMMAIIMVASVNRRILTTNQMRHPSVTRLEGHRPAERQGEHRQGPGEAVQAQCQEEPIPKARTRSRLHQTRTQATTRRPVETLVAVPIGSMALKKSSRQPPCPRVQRRLRSDRAFTTIRSRSSTQTPKREVRVNWWERFVYVAALGM
ncbi:hypothetical protein JG687_00003094 [Phytophthora cactorum]|uniref:Uncharacterized protein n=1 Tax=Phytophthora cactorum TaxID=29920 RepID=A0A8T1UVC5_9STRA|nr:hypothetical protein JG687_00003094 [Phytophthora cactorum]